MRTLGAVRATVIVFALWLGPVIGAWAWIGHQQAEEVDPSPAPSLATVGRRENDAFQHGTLHLEWAEPPRLSIQPIQGRVTSIHIGRGTVLKTGLPVLDIDGATKYASVGGTPFYRDIRRGMVGPDVTELDSLLLALGAATSPTLDSTGATTWATARAIQDFHQMSGGDRTESTFLSTDAIYVPAGFPAVGNILVAVGEPIGGNEPVLEATPRLLGASIDAEGSPQRRSDVLRGDLVKVFIPDIAFTLRSRLPTIEPATLDDLLRGLTSRVPLPTDFEVELRLAQPDVFGSIPGEAIVIAEGDQACIYAADGTPRTITLPTIAGDTGTVFVDRSLVGLSIISNPTELPGRSLDCTSNLTTSPNDSTGAGP